MTDHMPAPLVPIEVDLRDFAGMWLDTDRLLRSETWRLGTSDEKAAAMTLWLESWHEVPAASLPSNDRLLAKLSGAERWNKSREHALRGWVLCSDGRLYHPVVAEKALEAWVEKLASAISGAVGNSKRWNVEVDTTAMRAQFLDAVGRLRKIDPQSRVLKKKVVAVIVAGSHPESPPDVAGGSPPDITPGSPPDKPEASPPDRTDLNRPDLNRPDQTGTEQTGIGDRPSVVAGAAAPPAPDRGTRLERDWTLPKAWGDWALGEYPQWTADKVRREGASFRDHWTAKTGKDATKLDWLATWRNWCRSDIAHRDDPKPNGRHGAVSTAERDAEARRLLGFDQPKPEALPHA